MVVLRLKNGFVDWPESAGDEMNYELVIWAASTSEPPDWVLAGAALTTLHCTSLHCRLQARSRGDTEQLWLS